MPSMDLAGAARFRVTTKVGVVLALSRFLNLQLFLLMRGFDCCFQARLAWGLHLRCFRGHFGLRANAIVFRTLNLTLSLRNRDGLFLSGTVLETAALIRVAKAARDTGTLHFEESRKAVKKQIDHSNSRSV